MTWLLNRLFDHKEQPIPRFAFLGTVNWMRALAILTDSNTFESASLAQFYKTVQRRPANQEADTLAFENLLMALHNVASLNEFNKIENKYSVVRAAIIAWYYSLYYSSKSMLAAVNASDPKTHAKAGRILQTDVVEKNLIISPFSFFISDLTPTNIAETINALRKQNPYDLKTTPNTTTQAYGAVVSYLKGTAEYERGRAEEKVKSSSQFRELRVSNFRTKAARNVRDKALAVCHVNILVEAFRYRGKANYRDAIYLSYGSDYSETLDTFVADLAAVAKAYVFMVSHYLPRRVERDVWEQFGKDLVTNSKFELPFNIRQIE